MAGGTLRFALNEPMAVPFEATDADSLVVVDALFDSLTAWTANLALIDSAAERWETTDEGLTWIFHLRRDATFHDESATPVTAADFSFAWDLAVSQGAGFHLELVSGYEALRDGRATTLRGVTTPDPYTLRVRLREPYGAFPSRVAHPALGPVPRRLWEQDQAAFRRHPIGNGPFMAAEAIVPGQFLRVQRFEDWLNGPQPALLDEVLFQFMDPDTAFLAFQQERLQVSSLPVGAVELAREQRGRRDGYRGPGVIDGDTPAVYFLAFDVTSPPFDEPEVRRAVSLAIDREAVAAAVLGGNASPATALVAPAISGVEGACEACRHDPREARRLLARHGVEAITLWFNGDGGHRAIAQQVREDLGEAGIRHVAFRAPEFPQFLHVLELGEAEFFRYGWQPEYPLADDVLFPLFHSNHIPPRPEPDPVVESEEPDPVEGTEEPRVQATEPEATEPEATEPEATEPEATEPEATEEPPADRPAAGAGDATGRRNYMGYADPEVDKLLDDARGTPSTLRRMYLHRRVEDIVLNRDQVVVPILFYRHQRVVSDRVVGFTVNPMGLVELHRVQLRHDPQDASDDL
jgi:peptide/nickel transport system substrate-binding protein/oligopeptide transport system substrate-binding protein